MSNRGFSFKPPLPSRYSSAKLPVAVKITGIYLVVGVLWIFLSDRLLSFVLTHQIDAVTQLQTVKGWVYVMATAALLYGLINRETKVNRYAMAQLKRTLAELQATQTALRTSEHRYRQIVEGQTDFVLCSTADTTITFANTALCQIVGRSPAQVVGMRWQELVASEASNQAFEQKIAALSPQNSSFESIYPDCRANGQVGWTQWVNLGIFDEQGNLIEIQSVGRDITNLRQVEDALRQSEERFRAFMDYNPAASWITDAQGRIEYASRTYSRMFQVPPDLVGQNLVDLYPQAMAQEYLNNIQRVIDTGQVVETIEPGIRADDCPGEFLVYKFPLPQPDGSTHVGSVALDVTDKKKAEAALKISEERYRNVVETTLEGVWMIDTENCTSYVNSRMAEMLGYTVDEMLGRPLFDFMDEAGQAIAHQNLEARRQGIPEHHDFRFKTKTGQDLWVLISTNPLHDDTGTYVGALAMIVDISDRKHNEETLRQQFNLLEMAQQAAQMGVYQWDLVTDQAYWTPEMEAIMDLKLEERPGNLDVWFAQVHPDDQVRLTQQFQQWFDSDQQPQPSEYRFYRNGDERWIDARGYIIRDAEGRALKMIGTNLDITARKRAETALHQREQEFRALAENAPDIIVRFDRHLRHLYVNPAVEVATGLSPQKFLGKTNQELGMPAAQVALWDATFTRVFVTRQEQFLDFDFPTPGGLRDYQARCVPELAPDGTVGSILVVARDMTDQKQLERELRQHAERLELTSAIAQRIRQSLNLKEILNTTVIEINQWLQADRVIVYQFNPDMSGTVVAESVVTGWCELLGMSVVDTCFQTDSGSEYRQGKRRAIAHVDEAGLTPCHLQLLQRLQVKAKLVVPIVLMGGEPCNYLWGLLIAHQCSAPRQWHADHLELLDQIGLRLAIAIQQAQAFEQTQTELVERQQAERQLRAALAEKEVLLKEIHHRVKNNLQIVSGLLQLQAQGLHDPQIVNALRESQTRIESMSLIHKKLYTSSDLGEIDVADYIQNLAVSLLTSYQVSPGLVNLTVEVEPVILSLDQAIPCGLIINELVSNALKYAFPNKRSGEINIKLCQVDDQLQLSIQDNGIGLPDYVDWHQTNWQTVSSLGLSLVYALAVEQLDGTLDVDHNNGTRFTIKFPQSISKS